MEWVVVVLILVLPLVGFYPPKNIDGWTTYRDRALFLLALTLLVWLAIFLLPFAIIFGLLLLRYRRYEDMHGIVLWSFIVSVWVLVRSLPDSALLLLITATILGAIQQSLFTMVDFSVWTYLKFKKRPPTPIVASLGNRTYLGAYLAIIAPLTASWEMLPYLVVIIFATMLTTSRAAIPAMMIGVCVAWPASSIVIIPVGALGWIIVWRWLVTPALVKSLKSRWLIVKIALYKTMFKPTTLLIGHGYNSFGYHSLAWVYRYGVKEGFMHAHNDWVQFFFEYGLVGYVALLLIIKDIYPFLHFGSAMTGSLVSLSLTSLFIFPHHIGPIGLTILILLAIATRGVL